MVNFILMTQVKKKRMCINKNTYHKLPIYKSVNVKYYIYLVEHHRLYAVTKQLSKFSSNY